MSLILRKSCQPLLDTAGLDNYHADIINQRYSDRNLIIVGKCGQPFIKITGISFNRKAPTQTEVEYATELLQEFLAEHKKVIDEYIRRAVALKATPHPDLMSEDYELATNYNNIRYLDNGLEVTINEEGEVTEIAIRDNKLSSSAMLSFGFDKHMYEKMLGVLNDAHTYMTEQSELDDLKRSLSTCNI